MLRKRLALSLAAGFLAVAASASAQDREVPYWATIRAKELNMRVGPSADYRIEWVYRRAGLPVRVIRVMEGWRLIEDPDGVKGWVVARLLSPDRGAIVIGKGTADMRSGASADSPLNWRAQPGVVGALGECDAGWCEFVVGNKRGFIRADRIWGDDPQ